MYYLVIFVALARKLLLSLNIKAVVLRNILKSSSTLGPVVRHESHLPPTVFSSRPHLSQPKRVRQHHTTELLEDQAGLPPGWSLECETPSRAHRLHRLLDGE